MRTACGNGVMLTYLGWFNNHPLGSEAEFSSEFTRLFSGSGSGDELAVLTGSVPSEYFL